MGTLAPGTQKTFSMPCLRNTSANISTPCNPSQDVKMQISTSLVLVPKSLMVDLYIEVAEMMDDKTRRRGREDTETKRVSQSVLGREMQQRFRIMAWLILRKADEMKWSSYPNGSTLISCPGHSVSTISSILLMSRVLR